MCRALRVWHSTHASLPQISDIADCTESALLYVSRLASCVSAVAFLSSFFRERPGLTWRTQPLTWKSMTLRATDVARRVAPSSPLRRSRQPCRSWSRLPLHRSQRSVPHGVLDVGASRCCGLQHGTFHEWDAHRPQSVAMSQLRCTRYGIVKCSNVARVWLSLDRLRIIIGYSTVQASPKVKRALRRKPTDPPEATVKSCLCVTGGDLKKPEAVHPIYKDRVDVRSCCDVAQPILHSTLRYCFVNTA